MRKEELTRLIDELVDREISEADFLRLEAELQVDPRSREIYYERLGLDTALRQEARSAPGRKVVSFPKKFQTSLPVLAVAAAIFLVFAIGLGWKLGSTGDPVLVARGEPVATGFGVLAEQSDAAWEGLDLRRGDLLPSGRVRLLSGVAQLELFSGVRMILQGEADFEVHSAMDMSIHSGKLRAHVPEPAQGFRLRTAEGDVVDLGTEFAIEVSGGKADLQVVEGEVEWHAPTEPVKLLRDGQSNGDAPLGLDQFPAFQDLQNRRDERRLSWEETSRSLRKDPRLLAYFPMNGEASGERLLHDVSASGNDGFIVRAKRSSDRWEQSRRAIDFSPTGSRVRLNVPGEHAALTLYCWVRIDSLDRWYNSLFLTDGHELNEPHWQIMDDGRMFFSVKRRKATRQLADKHIAYSPPIWNPSLSGQWLQLATVYDGRAGTTTHYVNGKRVSRDVLSEQYRVERVHIGPASIGNWSEPMRQDPHFAVRNLNGSIDEFALFSAALTGAEIEALYEKGKP